MRSALLREAFLLSDVVGVVVFVLAPGERALDQVGKSGID
jgi:hypothetical protein